MEVYNFLVNFSDDITQGFRVLARVFPALLMISISLSTFLTLLKHLFKKR